ncbi:MAG: hypothetical protein ABIW81_08060 [Terrimesophilobacter sp.]
MRNSLGGRALLIAVGIALVLSACTSVPAPTPSPPEPGVSASASPNPSSSAAPGVAPTLLPDGTALANRAYFDYVNNTLFTKDPNAEGRAIIDNLIRAGFDKASLQVTPDKTAVLGLKADSIEFSVRAFDQCLIGQISGHGYHSIIGPTVSDGVCLVGKTRPIDWR